MEQMEWSRYNANIEFRYLHAVCVFVCMFVCCKAFQFQTYLGRHVSCSCWSILFVGLSHRIGFIKAFVIYIYLYFI
jgi:hypothetical protein